MLIIKRYKGESVWFVFDESGNTVCKHSLANVDQAIEWTNKHRPEDETRVVDEQTKADDRA